MGLLSKVTVSAVGLFSKALLNVGFCSSVTVKGLDNLKKALEDDERNKGRGVVTMSNHISTVFSTFFRYGQVIETFRGNGIFQPAIDTAIEKLNHGEWIHLFGEGKVNQNSSDPQSTKTGRLLRFKWGIGRIMMEAQNPPIVIPMWLTGFDKLMPEGRSFPYKFLPRPGAALSVTFGKPVPPQDIQDTLASLVRERRISNAPSSVSGALAELSCDREEELSGNVAEHGWLDSFGSVTTHQEAQHAKATEIARMRSTVTAVIQREVEALGKEVLGLHS